MSTQADSRSSAAGLGKIPTTSVRRFTSRLSRSRGLVLQIFCQWAWGKSANAVRSVLASSSSCATAGNWPARVSATTSTCALAAVAGGLREDRADRRGDHLGVAFADLGQGVAHEVDPAALPAGALQHDADRVRQAAVAVADDQLHPAEAAVAQTAQELGPEVLGLAVPDLAAQDLPAAVGGLTPVAITTAWDTTRPLDAGLAVRRVEEHVRERLFIQRPGRARPRRRRRAGRRSGTPRSC